MYSIRLYLEPDPSGAYTVTSPDVPGLVTEGRTPAEILENIAGAECAAGDLAGDREGGDLDVANMTASPASSQLRP